jgi:hypothetical protein
MHDLQTLSITEILFRIGHRATFMCYTNHLRPRANVWKRIQEIMSTHIYLQSTHIFEQVAESPESV